MMMNDMKKNELNELEMNQVTGGWFHDDAFEDSVNDSLESAYNAVTSTASDIFKIVEYVLFK